MTADRLIRHALDQHAMWWAAMDAAFDGGNPTKDVPPTACASASSIGLAVAMAWIAREYPDRADEVAHIVNHYIANGGDDHGLTAPYQSEGVAS